MTTRALAKRAHASLAQTTDLIGARTRHHAPHSHTTPLHKTQAKFFDSVFNETIELVPHVHVLFSLNPEKARPRPRLRY